MPFLLAKILNFQGSAHLIGVGSLSQEFIPGFDITTPIMFNPLTKRMELLPTLIYQPDHAATTWFLGENEKASHSGFKRYCVDEIDPELAQKYVNLAAAVSIQTFCRIDARVLAHEINEFESLKKNQICLHNTFFIEINPMPTIRIGNNYSDSLKYINKDNSFFAPWNIYKETFSTENEIGFILCCAMCGISNI